MKERGSLHPLRNRELAWTEQMPVPTVSYDLSLADEPYIAEFDIKRFSEYLIDQNISKRRARSLKVNVAKESPQHPNTQATYNPYKNKLEIHCGQIWNNIHEIFKDFQEIDEGFLIPIIDGDLENTIAHETQHIKDREKNFTFLLASTISIPLVSVGVSLATFDGLGVITDNEDVKRVVSFGSAGIWSLLASITASKYNLSRIEKRAYTHAEFTSHEATGILTLNPK